MALSANREKLNAWMRSVQAGRIVHALLFTGPKGVGKRDAAFEVAMTLLCTSPRKPCGLCPACVQVKTGNHPDLSLVPKLDAEKKGRMIGVDSIRELTQTLGMTSYAGGYRIAIIDPADRMNEQAQNALLKTLENPKDEVLFILIAASSKALLPTIVSRCREMRFTPLENEECREILIREGQPPDKAKAAAQMCEGSIALAREYASDPKREAITQKAMDALLLLDGRHSVAEAIAALVKADAEEQRTLLECLRFLGRDLMILQNGAQPFAPNYAHLLDVANLNGESLLKAVLRIEKQLASNVAWVNVLAAELPAAKSDI